MFPAYQGSLVIMHSATSFTPGPESSPTPSLEPTPVSSPETAFSLGF